MSQCEAPCLPPCPRESLEDGSVYAQYCAAHAREDSTLTRIEFGDVCLWCGEFMPSNPNYSADSEPCESFAGHQAVPADYPNAMPPPIMARNV